MPERLKAIRISKYFIVLTFLLASVFVVAQPTTGNITDKFASPGSSLGANSNAQSYKGLEHIHPQPCVDHAPPRASKIEL